MYYTIYTNQQMRNSKIKNNHRFLLYDKLTEEIMMKKKKSSYDLIKKIRGYWTMNPITRVQENELKSKKKRRQEEKKMSKREHEE